jgi:tricorn protease
MRPFHLFFVFMAAAAVSAWGQANRGYYRFPAIHGGIVFIAEGDLWEIGVEGGLARRLTTHPAEETRAAFSPDGKMIAFSADYEGPQEVYTMSASGGLPVRRTFDGATANVVGWTPDGKILYSTMRYSTLPDAQLITIDAANRIQPLPLSQAAQGIFDPHTGVLFFTRLAKQPSFTKRYAGGTAENLWKYDGKAEATPLTADYPGTSRNPMYWDGRIYFLTDRDGTMNVWSMDESGRNLRQHTHHQGMDVKYASLSDGRLVYQIGPDLRLLDIASGHDRLLSIELPSDFDNLREHWVKNPMEYLTALHLFPDGNNLILSARGRVFIAPVKASQGRVVDISAHKPGRYREGRLMSDGKSVVMLSSEGGEVEVWKYPADGSGAGEPLTRDAKVLRWEAIPSPDGKFIAHQDKDQQLWLVDMATKTDRRIATNENGNNSRPSFGSVRWSPDSRWLTYSTNTANGFTVTMLYNVETAVATQLTSDRYNSGAATWSADGKWLYFISDRALKTVVQSPWGSRRPDPYFDRSDKIYELALKKGAVSPFEAADELHPPKPEPPKDNAGDKTAAKPVEKPNVEVDLDGITSRIREVRVPPGNYQDLLATPTRLCWINKNAADPEKDSLECADIANKNDKPEMLLEGVTGFELSADNKRMLVHKKQDIYVFDSNVKAEAMKLPKTLTDAQVDLKAWNFSVIPTDEFREAFLDA